MQGALRFVMYEEWKHMRNNQSIEATGLVISL